jgi:hypothetical protein
MLNKMFYTFVILKIDFKQSLFKSKLKILSIKTTYGELTIKQNYFNINFSYSVFTIYAQTVTTPQVNFYREHQLQHLQKKFTM